MTTADVMRAVDQLAIDSTAPADAYKEDSTASSIAGSPRQETRPQRPRTSGSGSTSALRTRSRWPSSAKPCQNLGGAFYTDDAALRAALEGVVVSTSAAQAAGTSDTVVVFVNGIWNHPVGNATSRGVLKDAIEREAGRFPGLAVGSFYNVSARASCSVRGEANGFGRILATAKSWLCKASSGLPDDIVVAVLSNFGIPAQTDDAESLRSLLRALTDQGKKVVVVAHSDGNHVTRDALQRMRRGTVEDARRSQAIGVVMVGSPLPPEDMPVAGAVENGNYDNLAWVGLHHDPVAILGAFNALDESDFWGLTPELARLQLEIDAAMVHASVPWPFDLLVGQSRAEALADLAEALQDVIDEADRIGGSVPSLIRNSTGNGHNFVSSYLGTGSTSAQKILNEIARIRGNLPHPQDVNEAEEASSSLVSASGSFRANDGEFEVAVSPQDSKGNFVGEDLPPTSFAFENVIMTSQATGQQVSVLAKTTGMQVDLPISSYLTAVVLLDTSGSMRENDPLGNGRRDGADAFFAKLGGRDEVAVLDFPGTGTSRMLQDFTSDQTLLRAAVSSPGRFGGARRSTTPCSMVSTSWSSGSEAVVR